jgi:hypothetical protein
VPPGLRRPGRHAARPGPHFEDPAAAPRLGTAPAGTLGSGGAPSQDPALCAAREMCRVHSTESFSACTSLAAPARTAGTSGSESLFRTASPGGGAAARSTDRPG